MLTILKSLLLAQLLVTEPPPVIRIDRDNIKITQSCTVEIAATPIVDADGNGVIHLSADKIIVNFKDGASRLHGATADQLPDSFAGTGIRITGRDVTLRGASVSGFKVGIHAIDSNGLTIERCNVSDNFHQRLKSTPRAEDQTDWLRPHANDDHEWITNYGAGVCIEKSDGVTLRDVTARKGQNGIILDRVDDSKIFDCDCSSLSGWGLAMWRSSRNVVSRNAFDFCIRGYSHGVYNRGQDSAGILMFEQCCENVIAENSATHCGDGFFGFAGQEALGEVNPREDPEWHRKRGNNGNLLIGNDFSYAAAHGIELTFSFGNVMYMNHLRQDAICGIWGGYSSDSYIAHNFIDRCGDMAYGLERGGINIEHGSRNDLWGNYLSRNTCGIHLWSDDDAGIARTPWAKINGVESTDNAIQNNLFEGNNLDCHLRASREVSIVGNIPPEPHAVRIERDEQTTLMQPPREIRERQVAVSRRPGQLKDLPNTRLIGRENIIMTEWGPWDHESPMVRLIERTSQQDLFELQKMPGEVRVQLSSDWHSATIERADDRTLLRIAGAARGVRAYEAHITSGDFQCTVRGVSANAFWTIRCFPWTIDPREDDQGWHAESQHGGVEFTAPSLDLPFGHGGPSDLKIDNDQLRNAALPKDRFGTIATATLHFPAGRWKLATTSDDGIRVWFDDQRVIDDWKWHPPKEWSHTFEVREERRIDVRVEHFEIDGYATLRLDVESAE